MAARLLTRRPPSRLTLAILIALVATTSGGPQAAAATRPAPFRATCPSIFPASNVWNRRVDGLKVRSDSATLIASIGRTAGLHPDFGSFAGYGIPINVVTKTTPRSSVSFEWSDESDAGPYPIPTSPKIEGNGTAGDRHLLMLDWTTCRLFELYAASHGSGGWSAGSGAIWNLASNALRPDGWTSADAAGLPITPGLARYDEVAAGVIAHALRFTVPNTRSAHVYPARHDASDSSSSSRPPMGLRLRLKASVSISGFGPQARVILTALKRYGMILADNGSAIYVSGESNPSWDDDDLHELGQIKGSMFEVVDTTGFVNG